MRSILAATWLMACAGLLAGCATSYQKRGLSGGFSETALAPNVYRVVFNGNAYTSGERASDFTLLRSAELMLEKGFPHFAIVDASSGASYSAFTTPTTTNTTGSAQVIGNSVYGQARSVTSGGQTHIMAKPSTANMVVGFLTPPQNIFTFDALFVSKSLREKYELGEFVPSSSGKAFIQPISPIQ